VSNPPRLRDFPGFQRPRLCFSRQPTGRQRPAGRERSGSSAVPSPVGGASGHLGPALNPYRKFSDIRKGTWVDPRLAKTTLGTWVNIWYPAQDLEPSTLENYKYYIEVHILPKFSEREMRMLRGRAPR
jgi:Phage integrase, N-terminal SAM-like domain